MVRFLMRRGSAQTISALVRRYRKIVYNKIGKKEAIPGYE